MTVEDLEAALEQFPEIATEKHGIFVFGDRQKLQLVDAILADLDKPDAEIDRIWAEEARTRWAAYKAGRASTVSYETVMAKHLGAIPET